MTKEFANDGEKLAYAMGMNMGEYVSHLPLSLDSTMVAAGLSDYAAGKPALTTEEYQSLMQRMQEDMKSAGEVEMKRIAKANIDEEIAFMTENAKAEGVQVTPSGLQYKVVEMGNGAKPAMNSKVRVHYQGSLLNGNVFDSSILRGEPIEFPLTGVIAGWTEGLQLMPIGSKFRFFIPAALAYGERGAGQTIPPNAALIFDVELLAIVD